MKITQKVAKTVTVLGLLGLAISAQAFQINSLSPQGEVSQVRQLVVKFDEAAVWKLTPQQT